MFVSINSNTTCVTKGAGSPCPSEGHVFTPCF